MIKHIVWETHKLTRYQSKEFSYITFLYRANAKAYAYNFREQCNYLELALAIWSTDDLNRAKKHLQKHFS